MNILVVLPFCKTDQHLAVALLEWARELGALPNNDCLLLAATAVSSPQLAEVEALARQVFRKTTVIRPAFALPNESHPVGPNWMFETACKWVAKHEGRPWLWLEPDATVFKGWLPQIEAEYGQAVKAGKKILACAIRLNDPKYPALIPSGVAVYPPDAIRLYASLQLNRRVAWDVQFADQVMPEVYSARCIWARANHAHPPTYVLEKNGALNKIPLSSIPKEAALAHPCKDQSLIRLLRRQNARVDNLTVVITSFRRPSMLLAAFNSCLNAGVDKIVITATGLTPGMNQALNTIQSAHPSVKILRHADNVGSNQSWLAGVQACQTEYASILHDDDLLLPDYAECASEIIKSGQPFGAMQARNHGVPDYIFKVADTGGVLPTRILGDLVLKPNSLSISPTVGVFKTKDLAAWLGYAGGLPKACYYRPGFLVGNDLLLWVKASETYPSFHHVAKPGVSFGHWEGSTTVLDLAKENRLFGIYEAARQWHREAVKLHIVTIVLDGMPMITQHLSVLNKLSIPWHWSIVEGAARNVNCTKWCKAQKARLSKDGTTEYLNEIGVHPRVSIYRKPSWMGKIEMVNAPLPHIKSPCVLLQMDADEFWTIQQLESMVKLFASDESRTHAMFWCRYFFGPHLVMESRNCYGNNPYQDWKRAWRFKPGMLFTTHEPPGMPGEDRAFSHAETEAAGLVFEHAGYMFRKQVAYKEAFYGYKGAVKAWESLQTATGDAIPLAKYLPWVKDEKAVARRIQ